MSGWYTSIVRTVKISTQQLIRLEEQASCLLLIWGRAQVLQGEGAIRINERIVTNVIVT